MAIVDADVLGRVMESHVIIVFDRCLNSIETWKEMEMVELIEED